MSGHDYLSTGCLHGDLVLPDGRTGHEYCRGDTGAAGTKVPAVCKFCGAACRCICHQLLWAVVEFPQDWTAEQVTQWRVEFGRQSAGGEATLSRPRSVRVSRVVPGCWEARCLQCPDIDPYSVPWRPRPTVLVVAKVGTWERAMWRAGEHMREVHDVGV